MEIWDVVWESESVSILRRVRENMREECRRKWGCDVKPHRLEETNRDRHEVTKIAIQELYV